MRAVNDELWLLEEVRRAFGATGVAGMRGGSAAKIVQLVRPDGSLLVAKYQQNDCGGVDGHRVDDLRRQARQLEALRERLPALATYYAEVIGEFEMDSGYAYVMPHYPGTTLTQRMLRGVARRSELSWLVEVMIGFGYAARREDASADHFARVHIDRVRRRLELVNRFLPAAVAQATRLEINGQGTLHAGELLARLEDRALLARLQPCALAPPIHGDAVLSNFIWSDEGGGQPRFRAIDPRGTLEPWDPAYDFAKMLFSLSVYDLAMEGGFMAGVLSSGGAGELRLVLRLAERRRQYRRGALGFFELLEAAPSFCRLPIATEEHWRERILFANAMHCLAFAACRASAHEARGEEGGPAVTATITGFYLAGVAWLGALLDALDAGKTLELESYLDVLEPREPGEQWQLAEATG